MPGASFRENDATDFGTRDVLAAQAKLFAGDVPLDDGRVSPVYARLEGLAPTLVIAGDAELPRDDILRLADALERAGVALTRHVAADMPHNAAMFADYHPSAMEALTVTARFLRGALAG
jgi:acetyl esterase/lipase